MMMGDFNYLPNPTHTDEEDNNNHFHEEEVDDDEEGEV